MKSRAESGSPCLTPRLTEKKLVAKPLFNTQLDSLYKRSGSIAKNCSEIKVLQNFDQESLVK